MRPAPPGAWSTGRYPRWAGCSARATSSSCWAGRRSPSRASRSRQRPPCCRAFPACGSCPPCGGRTSTAPPTCDWLPAATYAERPGTTTNQEGRITRLGQKLTAPGVAWPDWMIAIELAARVGGELGLETLEDLWDEIERLAPSHAGITRRS